MVDTLTFTARFTPVEEGQVQATIDELPNVITAGRSREEAKDMLGDALHVYLLALGDREGRPDTPPPGHAEPLRITISV